MDDRQRQRQQRRQVLPDVSEGAELFGYTITSLLQLFLPAFAVMFYAINLAPDGLGGPLFALGLFGVFVTVIMILAAPSGEPPAEYAYNLYRQRTKQGVKVHE